jgi:hypothetical protein
VLHLESRKCMGVEEERVLLWRHGDCSKHTDSILWGASKLSVVGYQRGFGEGGGRRREGKGGVV